MTKRRGMSMAEVLVALFLMALGSIAILTMFPLGMFHMGQALKDDRTAQSAAQADAFMRTYWRTNVLENPNAFNPLVTTNPGYEPFVAALDYPDSKPDLSAVTVPLGARNTPPGTWPSVFGSSGPSYPVFVDPMGYQPIWSQNTPAHQYWVANGYYPRRSLNLIINQGGSASQRMCSLMDGFGFNESGTPNTLGGSIERELRYNWMWMIQRPDNTVRGTANMTVIVYDKRAFQFEPANAETGATTLLPMQPLTTSVQVPFGTLAVQKGGWIMDATPALKHAILYRVVSVTDYPTASPPYTDIELQTPIRRLDGGLGGYTGTLIYIAGVSEVFERPNLTPIDF